MSRDLKNETTSRKTPTRAPRFFTVKQVAEFLGVHDRTVKRWIASGELRSHEFGRSVRVSEDDLASFIAVRRR